LRAWEETLSSHDTEHLVFAALTHDSPDVLRRVVALKGLGVPFAHVTPDLWAELGLANSARENLPHPTTLVVAPDGDVVFRETHVDYKQRTDPLLVLERIEDHRQGRASSSDERPTSDTESTEPDWDHALTVSVARTPDEIVLILELSPGFHAYGALEPTSRPLRVTVDQAPEVQVPIPDGIRTELGEGLGTSWVLHGRVELPIPPLGLPADFPVSGTLDYQLCTDRICSPPASVSWVAPQ
jgi:hypothetical protein